MMGKAHRHEGTQGAQFSRLKATSKKQPVFLNEVKIALNLFSKSYHNLIIVGYFEISPNNVTMLTGKLNSIQEFVKIKPWLLLTFWICLHSHLKFHNSIKL